MLSNRFAFAPLHPSTRSGGYCHHLSSVSSPRPPPLGLLNKSSRQQPAVQAMAAAAAAASSPGEPSSLLSFREENGGYYSGRITGIPRALMWDEFVVKVRQPDRYLPVVDVATRDNEDGSVWRTMRIPPGVIPSMLQGITLVETIYMDEGKGEVRFLVLDANEKPTTTEHRNILHVLENGDLEIEYYDMDTATGARTPLRAGGVAMQKKVDNCRAKMVAAAAAAAASK